MVGYRMDRRRVQGQLSSCVSVEIPGAYVRSMVQQHLRRFLIPNSGRPMEGCFTVCVRDSRFSGLGSRTRFKRKKGGNPINDPES